MKLAEEGQDIETRLVSEHIRFVSFRYWREGVWGETWTGGDLPPAVEIVLGAQPLPAETEPQEYPHPTLRRVVYVPGGFVRQRNVIIRGGPGGSSP